MPRNHGVSRCPKQKTLKSSQVRSGQVRSGVTVDATGRIMEGVALLGGSIGSESRRKHSVGSIGSESRQTSTQPNIARVFSAAPAPAPARRQEHRLRLHQWSTRPDRASMPPVNSVKAVISCLGRAGFRGEQQQQIIISISINISIGISITPR